ncbi:MAG: hypothetical protein QOG88_48 [Actinomycetota bacterium]|jgi:hypothetical protein|nr:hypothetical protein [Actinomycetota bacterium]
MAYRTTTTGTNTSAMGTRAVLTLLGAGGMIVGSFLAWTNTLAGTKIGLRALWTTSTSGEANFFASLGIVMIALGLAAVLSLAFGSGWLTRLAGALGIITVVLFAIEVYRSAGPEELEIGAWVALAGSLVVLFAGLFGGSRTVTTTSETPPSPDGTYR